MTLNCYKVKFCRVISLLWDTTTAKRMKIDPMLCKLHAVPFVDSTLQVYQQKIGIEQRL